MVIIVELFFSLSFFSLSSSHLFSSRYSRAVLDYTSYQHTLNSVLDEISLALFFVSSRSEGEKAARPLHCVSTPDAAPYAFLLAVPRGFENMSKVPVSADDDFLLPGDADPATAAAESLGRGVDGIHPGMGKRDPPPLVFTKRSDSGL